MTIEVWLCYWCGRERRASGWRPRCVCSPAKIWQGTHAREDALVHIRSYETKSVL